MVYGFSFLGDVFMFKRRNQKLSKLLKDDYDGGDDFLIVKESNGEILYSNPVTKNDEIPVELTKRRVVEVKTYPMTFAVASYVTVILEDK